MSEVVLASDGELKIKPAISYGFKGFPRNFIVLFVALSLCLTLGHAINTVLPPGIGFFAQQFWASLFYGGLMTIILAMVDGQGARISMLTEKLPVFYKYLGGHIMFLICMLSFLLIVPGIFLCIRFGFYQLCMTDNNCGPIDGFKQSWALTEGNFWTIFLFGLAMTGIMVVPMFMGGLIFGVAGGIISAVTHIETKGIMVYGILLMLNVLMVVYYPAWGYMYRQLTMLKGTAPSQLRG